MNIKNSILRTQFFQNLAQLCDNPPCVEISHGKNCFLYDTSGKEYIDFISGISVSSFGHNNKKIIDAVKCQLDKHLHIMVYGEYIISPQVELAEKVLSYLPENLSKVYLTNSGTEAIEGAMKLAKRYTGKHKIVACKNAYHGSTQGALSIMGNEFYKQAYRPLLPCVEFMEYNNSSDVDFIDDNTACVVMEPIQSETGYNPANPDYLIKVREKCDETGALLILDEVQSGMGRTGSLFAFEKYGVVPDILVLAKAFGGGFPLGAFISSDKIMKSLSENPPLGHITTFGGHPVSCVASLAAFDIINENNFLYAVKEKGNLIRTLLNNNFGEENITGEGLMLAINFESEQKCQNVISYCLDKGLIADWFLFAPNRLRITPPLVIENDLIQKACNIIIEADKNT